LPRQKIQAKKEKEEMACWYNQGVHLGASLKQKDYTLLFMNTSGMSLDLKKRDIDCRNA